jgi:hypothetical protein
MTKTEIDTDGVMDVVNRFKRTADDISATANMVNRVAEDAGSHWKDGNYETFEAIVKDVYYFANNAAVSIYTDVCQPLEKIVQYTNGNLGRF